MKIGFVFLCYIFLSGVNWGIAKTCFSKEVNEKPKSEFFLCFN